MSQLTAKPKTTIAYTDGACKNNPGAGGWGVYFIFSDGVTDELFGGKADTTNNQMEMMATIQAIIHSPTEDLLEIWTDSSYVKDGITQWVNKWKQNGWKTAGRKEVKNKELWQELDTLNNKRNISWNWIKGHAGHMGNEKADELANEGVLHPLGNADTLKKNFNDSLTHTSQPYNQSSIHMTRGSNNMNNAHNNVDNNFDVNNNLTPAVSDENNTDWLFSDPLGLDDGYADEDLDILDSNLEILDGNNTINDLVREQTKEATNFATPHANNYVNNVVDNNVDSNHITHVAFDGDTSRANPNFRPLLPTPINKGNPHRQLIMDTETTGLNPNGGDRVIEVGIIELINRKFTGERFHVYTNPKKSMDDEVIRIHGITDAFLSDMPTFDKVAQQVYDFMDGAEIIAHNASFDMNFLNMEFAKVGLHDFSRRVKVTDSLVIAKQKYPGQKNTLDALVRRLNVGKQDRTFHGALLDSEILAEVYLTMTGGQVSLAIDDDKNDDGETSHKNFANLCKMLLTGENLGLENHENWLEKISKKNPLVSEIWGCRNQGDSL